MSFIRPELQRAVWRWREALVGVLVATSGIYMVAARGGFLAVLGAVLFILGAVTVFAGIQRSRFRVGQGGPGLVHVDERQVTYFGPLDGGSVSIDALVRVDLEPRPKPAAEWVLTEAGNTPLHIPTNAENAEALFDVFAVLDGIRTENMLGLLQANPTERVTIWQRAPRRLH